MSHLIGCFDTLLGVCRTSGSWKPLLASETINMSKLTLKEGCKRFLLLRVSTFGARRTAGNGLGREVVSI